jgi:membrane-associated protease RseP (regulator of RpoE activity)
MISAILILIVAFLSLIALMIIHEFGHFIIAKKFGVRVDEFGIGYPPRIFGKKIGETIYSINWIPLGAFVRIYGEEGGVDDLRSFANRSDRARRDTSAHRAKGRIGAYERGSPAVLLAWASARMKQVSYDMVSFCAMLRVRDAV